MTTGPQTGSPSRPKEVRLSKTVSSLTLHWRNSHPGDGPILGYYIEAKKKGKNIPFHITLFRISTFTLVSVFNSFNSFYDVVSVVQRPSSGKCVSKDFSLKVSLMCGTQPIKNLLNQLDLFEFAPFVLSI